jgi:nucleotide-binding universal stress UspA family protein
MTKTILLPLDGTAASERAVPFAHMLARQLPAKIVLLRAVLLGPEGDENEPASVEYQEARLELMQTAARLKQGGVEVEWTVVDDEPGWAIMLASRHHAADIVLMATHARGPMGRSMLGSVADRVLRQGPAPVLLVPPLTAFNWPPGNQGLRVVVPLDGSPLAERALDPAARLAESAGGELIVVHAIEPPYYAFVEQGLIPTLDPGELAALPIESLKTIAQRFTDRGISTSTESRFGRPADVVLAVARERQAHLIVMATHGRGGVSRLVTGSVADAVLRHTHVALMLVGPSGTTLDQEVDNTRADGGARKPALNRSALPNSA